MKIKIVLSAIFITMACASYSSSLNQFFCPDPADLNKSVPASYRFDVNGISGIVTSLGGAWLKGITSTIQANPFGDFLVAEEEQGTQRIICKYRGGVLLNGIVLLLPSVYKKDPTSRNWFRSINGVECTPKGTEGTKTCPLVLG